MPRYSFNVSPIRTRQWLSALRMVTGVGVAAAVGGALAGAATVLGVTAEDRRPAESYRQAVRADADR
jgi:hypothetical protein